MLSDGSKVHGLEKRFQKGEEHIQGATQGHCHDGNAIFWRFLWVLLFWPREFFWWVLESPFQVKSKSVEHSALHSMWRIIFLHLPKIRVRYPSFVTPALICPTKSSIFFWLSSSSPSCYLPFPLCTIIISRHVRLPYDRSQIWYSQHHLHSLAQFHCPSVGAQEIFWLSFFILLSQLWSRSWREPLT